MRQYAFFEVVQKSHNLNGGIINIQQLDNSRLYYEQFLQDPVNHMLLQYPTPLGQIKKFQSTHMVETYSDSGRWTAW